MNELDKLSPSGDELTRVDGEANAAALKSEPTPEKVVGEKESICACGSSDATESGQSAESVIVDAEVPGDNVCAEESSPAMDMAEAAESLDSNKAQDHGYHKMTKPELVEALGAIIATGDMEAHKEVAAIKQAFYTLHNRQLSSELDAFVEAGNDPEAFSATPDENEARFKDLLADFREKRNAYLEAKEEECRRNLEEKNRIISELKALAEDIDNVNVHFSKFQQLQQDFKNVGEIPPGSENEIWKSYQSTVEQFYDRLKMNKELRDLDFKKNLELKTILIEKAKELVAEEDVIDAFRRLQTLHEQWREIGPVAREVREEIWNQFKEASTAINKRHQDFFTERKATEQANEDAKTALCEKVEAVDISALKNFADWDKVAKEIIALQNEWKGLGFASRKVNAQLFSRFRKACDDFFTAKAEYFKKTKEQFKDNYSKKEALCEKAEALKDRFEDRSAYDEMVALQKEWRTIGMVPRRQGDEIWKRFCTAVDAFHDARKKLLNGRRDEETENLKVKKSIIARLAEIPEDAERKDVIDTIRELQAEWQKTGHVPFKQKDAIQTGYRSQLDRLFSAFDLRESRQRMRRFEGEVKKMEGDGNKIGRERDRLVRALENRQAELKTIENNLGFFNVKSSAGNSLMKDLERRIERTKEDIAQLREKIALLDKEGNAPAAE
ncbi:MAG: DUF349 domain-containing protein [Muribaculaceae bacterium]|nr:DUF349 domain-containing protein [Muribaculaceae bacterium]